MRARAEAAETKLTDQDSTLAQFSVKIDVLRSERDAAQAKLVAIREVLFGPYHSHGEAIVKILAILDGSGT